MNYKTECVGKLTHQRMGWRIYEEKRIDGGIYRYADPSCRSCQARPQNPTPLELVCEIPRCAKRGHAVKIDRPLSNLLSLVVNMWEGEQNRREKMQFLNFDQELIPLAEARDSNDAYWCTVKLLGTDQGVTAMVLAGKKENTSKVQFFVKDKLNQITFDQVGDLNPEELFLSFQAQFSNGATTSTSFPAS